MRRHGIVVTALLVGVPTVSCEGPQPTEAREVSVMPAANVAQAEGPPIRDVLTQTVPQTCLGVGADGQPALTQVVNLRHRSTIVLYFAFEWGSLTLDEEGLLSPSLDSAGSDFEWGFAGTPTSRTSGTVMWSFAGVPPGLHTVAVGARLEGGDLSAELNDCALTVFVVSTTGRG